MRQEYRHIPLTQGGSQLLDLPSGVTEDEPLLTAVQYGNELGRVLQ
ncbi:hypothetical protein SGRI78S_01180 [Streptomyces griseus subsp. griseus]